MKVLFVILFASMGFTLIPHTDSDSIIKKGKPSSDSIGRNPRIIPMQSPFTVGKVADSKLPVQGIAGYSKNGRPIEAFYFPGTSDKRAIVIGGVHGSELSAIEVAKTLVAQLVNEGNIYYSVIIIPCLFPDNANHAESNPVEIGSIFNIGRYSHDELADPNRQMPALGKAFDKKNPVDYAGRPVEKENQLLLELIQEFKPQRIINIHAIRTAEKAGVFADPRTDENGNALEFFSDSSLAIDMARYIESHNGYAPGNNINKKPTAVYYCDPPVAPPGEKQKRNLQGSKLPGNRGFGVSLGSWASTAVHDDRYENYNRPAIRLFTMEFPGNKRPSDYAGFQSQLNCLNRIDIYATSIARIFLARKYVEI